ncbi:MAG: hypothetical protein RL095_3400 [Verrucomicrobiota bacterium]|jgi:uncharacterized protein (UPF0276 family)
MKPPFLGAGLFTPADPAHLELISPLFEEADFFEISPEMMFTGDSSGRGIREHPLADLMAELGPVYGKPFVGHGLHFSVGDASPGQRRQDWMRLLRRVEERFRCLWYTEHSGWTSSGGEHAVLPLPLPHSDEAAAPCVDSLRQIQEVFPLAGLENSVFPFLLGEARAEYAFLQRILDRAEAWLLLDLHNLHTHALNFGVPAADLLAQLKLDRVIEIHISGGSVSDPDWLASGRTFRLDSHDGAVPEEVWSLLDEVMPLCGNLRGVVLERLHGTLLPEQTPAFFAEFARLKRLCEARKKSPS